MDWHILGPLFKNIFLKISLFLIGITVFVQFTFVHMHCVIKFTNLSLTPLALSFLLWQILNCGYIWIIQINYFDISFACIAEEAKIEILKRTRSRLFDCGRCRKKVNETIPRKKQKIVESDQWQSKKKELETCTFEGKVMKASKKCITE